MHKINIVLKCAIMSKLTERIANYCCKTSGRDISISPMSKQLLSRLPLVITGSYACYEAVLMDIPVVLLEVLHDDYTPGQLQKHQQIVTRIMQRHTIFGMDNVASYHISRMVQARVNFIIPDKQMYVPSLLVNLREVKDTRRLDREVMPGAAQCLLLYHLQRASLNDLTTAELADKFNTSYASMSRALRWLQIKELVQLDGVKEKALHIAASGMELWKTVLPLMLSPVERTLYTDLSLGDMPYAGETALEKYTMMAGPEIPCKAVAKSWATDHKDLLNKNYGDNMVEVWRYDPALLAENNVVDPLSLYLSLQTSEDERVKIELNRIIENIKWLKD